MGEEKRGPGRPKGTSNKPKMGRPKATIKRDNKICVYLTDVEVKKLEGMGEELGLSASIIAKSIILKGLK